MKQLIFAGLTLAVISLGIAATYRGPSAPPVQGLDLVNFRAEPLPRPVLRLEGFTRADPESTPSQVATRVLPSGLVSSDVIGRSEEPL